MNLLSTWSALHERLAVSARCLESSRTPPVLSPEHALGERPRTTTAFLRKDTPWLQSVINIQRAGPHYSQKRTSSSAVAAAVFKGYVSAAGLSISGLDEGVFLQAPPSYMQCIASLNMELKSKDFGQSWVPAAFMTRDQLSQYRYCQHSAHALSRSRQRGSFGPCTFQQRGILFIDRADSCVQGFLYRI